jgi:regulator of protease activity HflC (stomatin/prohibitin superfamily)
VISPTPFQTKEGMEVGADIGISYHLDPAKVSTIFQKYRKGVGEITDIFIRNHVRDALNTVTSTLKVEDVYGLGKAKLINDVQTMVTQMVEPIGIMVDKIYLIGSFRLPKQVTKALNAKLEATQRAQQRENEVAEAKAEANKKIAQSEGKAKSILTVAKAQAEANSILAKSLTKNLVEYEKIKRWNGQLPKVSGSGTGILMNMGDK